MRTGPRGRQGHVGKWGATGQLRFHAQGNQFIKEACHCE